MKRIVALVAVLVTVAAASANAAEPSKSGLAAMGLPGLKVMSDSEGAKVRGTGVWAINASYAKTEIETRRSGESEAGTINAVVSSGRHAAGGKNISFAASGKVDIDFGPVEVNGTFAVAGGAARGFSW